MVRTGMETGKQERGESVLYVYVHVVAWQMYVCSRDVVNRIKCWDRNSDIDVSRNRNMEASIEYNCRVEIE